MATLFVVVAGVSAIAIQRSRLAQQRSLEQARLARVEVASAMELGLSMLAEDPSGLAWRTDKVVEISAPDLRGSGDARVLLTLSDPSDADLTDDPAEPVHLSARVVSGGAVRVASVVIDPVVEAFDCLGYAVVAGSEDRRFGSTHSVSGSTHTAAPQSAAKPTNFLELITLSLASMSGRVNAVEGQSPDEVAGAPALPSDDIFDLYAALATPINYVATLGPGLLSPTSNPWGATNARGIYVIDCKGQNIELKSLRVRGTLVLLNAGASSRIDDGVAMEPAFPDQPTLLVQGTIDHKGCKDLLESSAGNLNPAGSPYLGSADADATDAYPAIIRGVTFIDGDLAISQIARFDGVLLVSGKITIHKSLIVTHRAPEGIIPGLSKATSMAIRPGTVQRDIVR
jgi:hypothetical protein